MRLKVVFDCNEDIVLPVDYNYYIQSFIYKNISNEMADFLHNKGYCASGRSFKLFSFSKLIGKCSFDRNNQRFRFKPPVSLYISSPVDDFIKSFANHILINDLFIFKSHIEVSGMDFQKDVIDEEIHVITLSPVVVYSTLFDMQKKRHTCYFMPREPKYNSLIEENLKKKCIAFGNELTDGKIEITPAGNIRQKILTYKGFTIKGCEGLLKLKGSSDMIRMALDAGLGSKNSQGFGCIRKQ